MVTIASVCTLKENSGHFQCVEKYGAEKINVCGILLVY